MGQDIRDTWNLFVSKRMLIFMPIVAQTAFTVSIYGSLMIKIIVETMVDEAWDDQKKNSTALLCMVGLGVGEIAGSLILGIVLDKCSMTVSVFVGLLINMLGLGTLIIYTLKFSFDPYLCTVMTFTMGMQDCAGKIFSNCICGFQFESKTVPFAVLQSVRSVLIFVITCFESLLTTRDEYLYYFVFDMCFAIFAYSIFKCCFTLKPKATEESPVPEAQMVETESTITNKA